MHLKPIITGDNSSSLFHEILNETYHSIHGAIDESQLVFIDYGLRSMQADRINILEIGFGTGLNALLTLKEGKNNHIYYKSIEAFPINIDLVDQLNYTDLDGLMEFKSNFRLMHSANWNEDIPITETFILQKKVIDLRNFVPESVFYDLIYFDAFSPNVQPELWTEIIFSALFQALKHGGILVTYSSKGSVKQALRTAGFTVQRLRGPHGKRHVLRAQRIT